MSVGRADHDEGSSEPPAGTSHERWVRIWAHRALLLWVARRHGANADDVEDVVQEALLRAAEHPEIAEERLQAWLVAVTRRLCIDGHRRRTREASRWQRESAQAVVPQPGQHPEDEACERAEAARVASLAAELLPPRQVQALRLTAAGCDVQQVASELGVRYRAAESLLARARRTLRAVLGAGVGVLVWTWRAPSHAAGHAVPIGLAAAAAAAIAIPVILLPHELRLPWTPPSAAAPAPPGANSTGQILLHEPGAPPPSPGPVRAGNVASQPVAQSPGIGERRAAPPPHAGGSTNAQPRGSGRDKHESESSTPEQAAAAGAKPSSQGSSGNSRPPQSANPANPPSGHPGPPVGSGGNRSQHPPRHDDGADPPRHPPPDESHHANDGGTSPSTGPGSGR